MVTLPLLVSRHSQSEEAYRSILDQILRGRLVPGAPLSRRGLAQALRLGVRPVTEALQRLEVEGLIESLPRIGTRVKLPSEQDVRGQYIVREALEAESARLFAEKSSTRERNELTATAEHLDSLYEAAEGRGANKDIGADYRFEVHNIHMRFHMRIAECSGCPALCKAIEKNQILVWNLLYDTAYYSRPTPGRWHHELMEALNTGDVEIADRAMRTHVRYRMDDVLHRREVALKHADGASLPAATSADPSAPKTPSSN